MNKKYYSVEKRLKDATTEFIKYIEVGDLYNINRYADKILKLKDKFGNNGLIHVKMYNWKAAWSICMCRGFYEPNIFETLPMLQECVSYLNEDDKTNGIVGIALSLQYRKYISRSEYESVLLIRHLFNQNMYDVRKVNPVRIDIKDKEYYGFISNDAIELTTLPHGLRFVGYINNRSNTYGHIVPYTFNIDTIGMSFNKRRYVVPVINDYMNMYSSLYVHESCTIEADNNIRYFDDSVKIDDIVDIEYKELPDILKQYYNPKYSPIEMVLEDDIVVRGLIADYNVRPEKLELFKDNSYIYKVIADVAGIQPIRLEEYNPTVDKESNIDYTDPTNGTVFISNNLVNVPVKIIYATSADEEVFDELSKI